MTTSFMSEVEERRRHRRVFSLSRKRMLCSSVQTVKSILSQSCWTSAVTARDITADPTVSAEPGSRYKLYLQNEGAMFHLEAVISRTELQFFAFHFVNVTPLDLMEIRSKLARMEILAARMCGGH